MKNIYFMWDKYTIKNNKIWQGNVEHRYVMQGRPIVQEIVIIIHKLNLIYKYYNTVYQTSVL